MTALHIKPLAWTYVNGNQAAIAPVINANKDEKNMVWRSANLTTVYCIIDLGTTASYDYVGFIGMNLRSTDTIQIRTGATNTGIGSYAGTALAAHNGVLPTGTKARKIFSLGGTRTERYMRIDITATGHPDGFTQLQRLVVGKAITTDGWCAGAKQKVVDQSVLNSGAGFFSAMAYDAVPQWDFRVDFITAAEWRSNWYSLLQRSGKHSGILVTPDFEAGNQIDILFGTITNDPDWLNVGADLGEVNLQVTAFDN